MSGWVLWFTGLPASGKTTIARALRETLQARNIHTVLLDSDELRLVLTPTPTYSDAERDQFYKMVVGMASLLTAYNTNVLITATAPKRAYRDRARQCLSSFAEIWVRCPLTLCEARDPKGLYQRAHARTISHLPGVTMEYEEPFNATLILESDQMTVSEAVEHILHRLPWVQEPCMPQTSWL
jgi:adenylylsulfate kinase